MIRALCVLFFFLGASWPTAADTTQPLTTILLVPRTNLPDPNFNGSVVLVMNNIGSVPAGLIVNRPTRITVSHLFPDVKNLEQLDDKVYFGGPVEIASVSFLFRADSPPDNAAKVLDGVYFSTNRELLLKLFARHKPMAGLRIFIGYSGWAPGQLETEIERRDWTIAPADVDAIFNAKPSRLWPEEQAPAGMRRT